MTVNQLEVNEYNGYFQTYINKVGSHCLSEGLKKNGEAVVAFFNSIPEAKFNYKYSDDKWTVKEVLLHIIDTERIFAYRALRILRQDNYVKYYNCLNRTMSSLIKEYQSVRSATQTLFDSCDEVMLKNMGVASNNPISARAIGFIIIGHENHHIDVLKERYL